MAIAFRSADGSAADTNRGRKKKAHHLQGLHGTTLPGAINNAKERRLRALNYEGVYAHLVLNPRDIDEMLNMSCHKTLTGPKNQSGIVWELAVKAEVIKHSSGGTEADNDTCAAGFVSHMRTSSENRWCTPEDLIQLRALWETSQTNEGVADSQKARKPSLRTPTGGNSQENPTHAGRGTSRNMRRSFHAKQDGAVRSSQDMPGPEASCWNLSVAGTFSGLAFSNGVGATQCPCAERRHTETPCRVLLPRKVNCSANNHERLRRFVCFHVRVLSQYC